MEGVSSSRLYKGHTNRIHFLDKTSRITLVLIPHRNVGQQSVSSIHNDYHEKIVSGISRKYTRQKNDVKILSRSSTLIDEGDTKVLIFEFLQHPNRFIETCSYETMNKLHMNYDHKVIIVLVSLYALNLRRR